jgi:transposase
MHTWSEPDQPLRLPAKELPKGERKALSCYGLWLPQSERMLLRFVERRPVSAVTEAFLEWVSAELQRAGKQALLLVWDNASWHVSERVRDWLRTHNRQVKRGEKVGVRLVVCRLPKQSPWLNPIEPKWLHGKRNVAEAGEVLDEIELMARVYEHFDCPVAPLLSTTVS